MTGNAFLVIKAHFFSQLTEGCLNFDLILISGEIVNYLMKLKLIICIKVGIMSAREQHLCVQISSYVVPDPCSHLNHTWK